MSKMVTIKESLSMRGKRKISQQLIKLKEFWRRYKKNRAALIGLALVFFLFTMAIFAPYIATSNPFDISNKPYQPPNRRNLMGTDNIGKDTFSGVVYGARASLMVGVVASAIASLIGTLMGSISGYYGDTVDDIIMRFTDMFLSIPSFFLILLIVALFGGSILNIMVVIGIMSWPQIARIIRGEFLSLKERDFVEAVRLIGASDMRIIFIHILPNALSPVIVSSTLRVASAILQEAYLSFLGLGDPTIMSWGLMLRKSMMFFIKAPWTAVFPGFFMFLSLIGFNLVGDGLNDALNPRLKER